MPRVRSASGLMISIGPDLVGEVGEIGRLIAGAGADLEHLLARACTSMVVVMRLDHVRSGDRHAVADVEEGVVVGAAEILLEHELLARHQQERALVAVVQDILVARPAPRSAPSADRGISAPRRGSPPSS